ncbi:MAG TPA: long-chain-fatty-acid--CoA ligase [Acidimicrobiales bacterium]|nr:long-chain-fatty-acid--CoA ligase [Acidimicrobiales bacterium]
MNVPLTPLDFLERARRYYGPLDAVVDGERRLTYAEFVSRCHRLAHALRADLGLGPGGRVAYLCGNTLELLEAYYGVVLAGGILTPLNVRLGPLELQAILEDSTASMLFVHPSFRAAAGELLPRRRVDLDDQYEALLAAQPADPFEPDPFGEDDVCELFYTSGTTSSPKGAMLTHRNLATHAIDSALTLGLGHRDVVLHTIPLFHVNGWGTPHYVTALGARHVLLERFDAGEVLRLVEAERVTRLSLVPTMAQAVVDHPDAGWRDLSSLLQVTVGGAASSPELLAGLEELMGCEVMSGYGLTEASPQLTKAVLLRSHDGLPVEDQRRRHATTGLPNVGVDLRVFDADDNEVPRDGETVGEICVRSNHVMAGYWKQPAASEVALRGGWLRTGDLATVDAEGYVTIVDRAKDIIVSGGENVSSIQVEHVLSSHPAVAEVAVVPMRDEKWGEVPRAFVALRKGSGPVSERELIDWVRERLAHFKAPKRIDFLPELPKGGTGKVQKADLRGRP